MLTVHQAGFPYLKLLSDSGVTVYHLADAWNNLEVKTKHKKVGAAEVSRVSSFSNWGIRVTLRHGRKY